MGWQQNLFDNLLVVFILLSLVLIIYCKVTGRKLLDLIKDLRGGFKDE